MESYIKHMSEAQYAIETVTLEEEGLYTFILTYTYNIFERITRNRQHSVSLEWKRVFVSFNILLNNFQLKNLIVKSTQ